MGLRHLKSMDFSGAFGSLSAVLAAVILGARVVTTQYLNHMTIFTNL
jgi:hypothetical protein